MASYTSKVIAVLGRTLRSGRWKLADDTVVIALFGRCVVDLTRAYVDEEDDELAMSIFAVFGSVSVLLPAGCDVEPSGVAVVASSEIEIPSDRPTDITKTALAPLDVSWLAMFAKVRVAEVRADATAGLPAAAVAALSPPAVEVFGGIADAAVIEPERHAPVPEPEPEPMPVETSQAFDDPDTQAAALRDEIAQWRAESARRATDNATDDPPNVSPEDEIIDEGETVPSDPVVEESSTT